MDRTPAFSGLRAFGLTLRFAAAGRGSGFPGAAWRGLMGHALADAACAYGEPACAACPMVAACAYPRLFKPAAEGALPPFWLHGWRRGRDSWSLGIRWLGEENTPAVGEWLAALARPDAGRIFGGAPVRLADALDADGSQPAWSPQRGFSAPPRPLELAPAGAAPAACRVRFVTPLVSKHGGDQLFGALHTRLQRLVRQHGDGASLPRPPQPWRARTLAARPARIPLARRILAGTLLELELEGIDPDAWRLLRAGEELHAGGQAAAGCGHYRIVPPGGETPGEESTP